MRQALSLESLILAGICIADMIATVVLVAVGCASESNPLMAACMRHSVYTFIAVKVASFAPFILLCEYHRRRNPVFVRGAMRSAIVLYLVAYVALVTHQNVS